MKCETGVVSRSFYTNILCSLVPCGQIIYPIFSLLFIPPEAYVLQLVITL